MLPERRYRTAIVALRHGNWEDAAHHLLTIAAEYPSYRDVEQVLTRLERTRPAAYWRAVIEVALARNAWDQAAKALERLSDLNPAPADLDALRDRLAAQLAAPAPAPTPPQPGATQIPAVPAPVSAPPTPPVEQPATQAIPTIGGDSRGMSSAFRNPLFDFVSDPLPEILAVDTPPVTETPAQSETPTVDTGTTSAESATSANSLETTLDQPAQATESPPAER